MAAPTIPTTSSGTGTTVTYPTGLTVGDTLVVLVGENGAPTDKYATGPSFSDANGKIFTEFPAIYGAQVGLFYRVIDGSEGATGTLSDASATSLTFSWLCLRISGAGSSPINAYYSPITSTTASSFAWPAITTTMPNTLIVLFGATKTPTSALDTSAVTGYTRNAFGRATTVVGCAAYSITQAAAGSNGAQATTGAVASASSAMVQYAVAFGASSAAGGGNSRGYIID